MNNSFQIQQTVPTKHNKAPNPANLNTFMSGSYGYPNVNYVKLKADLSH